MSETIDVRLNSLIINKLWQLAENKNTTVADLIYKALNEVYFEVTTINGITNDENIKQIKKHLDPLINDNIITEEEYDDFITLKYIKTKKITSGHNKDKK